MGQLSNEAAIDLQCVNVNVMFTQTTARQRTAGQWKPVCKAAVHGRVEPARGNANDGQASEQHNGSSEFAARRAYACTGLRSEPPCFDSLASMDVGGNFGVFAGSLRHESHCMQEEKLSALVDEYGHLGRRSYKRIANAFPGGFSSAAIKRHMARLNLSLSSGSKRAQLEDLSDGEDGIMDQKEQLTNRKRSRDPASTRDADTHVQDDDISSGRDEYFASRPSAKKHRESTSMALEEGSQGPDLSAVNDIEDAVDVDGSRAKGEPELSDQDECGAMIPAKTADRGWHSTTSKGRKRVMETSTALGSKQTVRQDEACRKKKEKAKSVKSAQRSMVTSLSSRQPCDDAQVPEPAVKLNKGSGMNTTHSVSAFALRMDGMNAAAENMVLDLRKDGAFLCKDTNAKMLVITKSSRQCQMPGHVRSIVL